MLIAPAAQSRTFVVDNQNPRASDTAAGDAARPLKTINAAARQAGPGDEIVVNPGIYRETIVPVRGGEEGKPIVYCAAQKGSVVIKATEVWRPRWKEVAGQTHVYRAELPVALLTLFNPFALQMKSFDGMLSQGQVFYQGQLLPEVVEEKPFDQTPLSWRAVDKGRAIQLYAPQGAPRELEISMRPALFRPAVRGLGYITLRDFVFEGSANALVTTFWKEESNPQAGAVSTRSGHHWTIEGNVIRFAKSSGLDCGSEGMHRPVEGVPAPDVVGHHVVRGNVVSDNGQAGIYGSRQIGSRFEKNVIARNNTLRFDNFEEAGMKCHYFVNGVIEGNLFMDNEGEGLWLDNVWHGTRVSHNAFIGNRSSGLFMEMGRGPALIEGNIFGWSRVGFIKRQPRGDGVYAHDSSGFTLRENLIVNNHDFGVFLKTATTRRYDVFGSDMTDFSATRLRRETVGASDITVKNNLIASNPSGISSLRFDGDVSGNDLNENLLSAPLTFEINSFAESEKPAPKELVGKPMNLQKWRELTGHDTKSLEVEAKAELIRGVRPVVRIVAGKPVPDALTKTAQMKDLPFELQIETRAAR